MRTKNQEPNTEQQLLALIDPYVQQVQAAERALLDGGTLDEHAQQRHQQIRAALDALLYLRWRVQDAPQNAIEDLHRPVFDQWVAAWQQGAQAWQEHQERSTDNAAAQHTQQSGHTTDRA